MVAKCVELGVARAQLWVWLVSSRHTWPYPTIVKAIFSLKQYFAKIART